MRLEGQEYTSATRKIIPAAKKMKYVRCKCIHKCADNISTESRQISYDNYWKVSNREQRKQSLLDRINNHHPKQRRLYGEPHTLRKQFSSNYYLHEVKEDGMVCDLCFYLLQCGEEIFRNLLKNNVPGESPKHDQRLERTTQQNQ